jgi:hypothetical protein
VFYTETLALRHCICSAAAGVLALFQLFLCSYFCDVFVCSGATISETETEVNEDLLFL